MGIFVPNFPRSSYRKRPAMPMAAPEVVEAYRAAHPDVCAWLDTAARRDNDFACSLKGAINRYGKLTDNQLAAVRKCIARDAERAESYRLANENAPECSIIAIETAFASAKAAGVSRPKLTFEVFTFSPAGERSANPGAIYVKDRQTGTYYGKVHHGKFVRSRQCNDDAQEAILRTCADPHNAAIAHGKKFGVCCVCNRTLTDAKSVEAGIGPVCEKNYGWRPGR